MTWLVSRRSLFERACDGRGLGGPLPAAIVALLDEPPTSCSGEQAVDAESAEALDDEPADRRESLLGLATVASWTANDAGVDHTPQAIYEALLDGLDHPDETVATRAG